MVITILLAGQNEGENHIHGQLILTHNCQGFGHDSSLHVRDRTLKMVIFGLEKP